MTSKNDGPGKGSTPATGTGASDPKRTYATIDAKATDITSQASKKDDPANKQISSASATSSGKPTSTTSSTSSPGSTSSAAGNTTKADAAKSGPSSTAPAGATTAAAGSAKPVTGSASATTSSAARTTSAPPVQRASGGGFFSHTLAGLIGGALMLVGGHYLQPQISALLGPQAGQDGAIAGKIDAVTKRLAAVEKSQQSAPAGGALADKLAAAEKRVASLESALKTVTALEAEQKKLAAESKTLAAKLSSGGAGGDAQAQSRLAKLEDTLRTLSAAAQTDPNNAGRLPQLAALTGRMADLETALTQRLTELRKDLVTEVDKRVAATAEASEAAKSGTQRIDREIATMRTDAARAGQRIETLKSSTDRIEASVQTLKEETAGLRSAFDGFKVTVEKQLKTAVNPDEMKSAIAPVTSRLTAFEQKLQNVVKGEENRKTNAERIVLALELANLKRALDRGQPFAPELAEVKKIAGNKLDLSALEKRKATGVPSLQDLTAEFRKTAYAILDAEVQPEGGNVLDRLLSGAKSIVRVRKVNVATDDTSTEAIVARMESAVQEGRLSAVIAASEKLSAKGKAAAKGWLEKVAARDSVDKAIAAIEASLKTSLAGAPAADAKGTKQ